MIPTHGAIKKMSIENWQEPRGHVPLYPSPESITRYNAEKPVSWFSWKFPVRMTFEVKYIIVAPPHTDQIVIEIFQKTLINVHLLLLQCAPLVVGWKLIAHYSWRGGVKIFLHKMSRSINIMCKYKIINFKRFGRH